jgi:predicted enzyme related to lactoylglutathione lyase
VSVACATILIMQITSQITVFDAPDLAAESSFWASLLGGTVRTDSDWHTISVDGQDRLAVQLAPDHVAPDWPANTTPQQIHLDLTVDDIEAAHRQAIAAGARVLQDADRSASSGFVVYADPAGHPFCLCW